MIVNPLPPQAYTKETLQKAYAWLLNQSPSLKDMATTQDMLISLYLKAQRNGEASLETPSIQNFKQELKNLASMIGDLQTPNPPSIPINTPAPTVTPSAQNKAVAATTMSALTQNIKEATPVSSGIKSANTTNTASVPSHHFGQLDLQSLQILSEVRQNLNLSSDMETLRALISLGYKQIKKMN